MYVVMGMRDLPSLMYFILIWLVKACADFSSFCFFFFCSIFGFGAQHKNRIKQNVCERDVYGMHYAERIDKR